MPRGGCLPRGVFLEGCLPRGVSLEGCLPRGVFAQGGGCLPGEGLCARYLPVNRITDRCKNITLLQLCCGQ